MTDAILGDASESPPPAAASVTGPRGGGVSGATSAPRVASELWATNLLGLSEEYVPVWEEAVKLALQPNWEPPAGVDITLDGIAESARLYELMRTVLRTGGLFLFDRQDIPPGVQLEPITELPPLPFSRVWIEVEGILPHECSFMDTDGRLSMWLGFGIFEREPGRSWQIVMPMLDQQKCRELIEEGRPLERATLLEGLMVEEYWLTRQESPDPMAGYVGCSLTAEGGRERLLDGSHTKQDRMLMSVGWTPELLIQLLHTLGVTLHPVSQHRAVRRQFSRKHGYDHPQVYFVSLRSHDDNGPGKGDRVFRHRWIVRGHYRVNPKGRHFLPHKGSCSWVRPYIKGPAGAPWKGRPVYHTVQE